VGFDDTSDEGLTLGSIRRGRPLTDNDRDTVRQLAARHAESEEDEKLLIAMLGLDICDTPPDFRCNGDGCDKQLYAKNWPTHWRTGRVLCNNDRGICMSCRRKERIAAGELPPPKPREKSAKPRPYKRRVVRAGTEL
jgi:hypothetical protein